MNRLGWWWESVLWTERGRKTEWENDSMMIGIDLRIDYIPYSIFHIPCTYSFFLLDSLTYSRFMQYQLCSLTSLLIQFILFYPQQPTILLYPIYIPISTTMHAYLLITNHAFFLSTILNYNTIYTFQQRTL